VGAAVVYKVFNQAPEHEFVPKIYRRHKGDLGVDSIPSLTLYARSEEVLPANRGLGTHGPSPRSLSHAE
jgi:hypothetical protein